MKVEKIELVRVIVPAHPGAVNSPEVDHPLHRPAVGADAGWKYQFDELEKVILLAYCDDGTIGVGESSRGSRIDVLSDMARRLIDADVAALSWAELPFALNREYFAIETLVCDLVGKRANLPFSQLLGGKKRDHVLASAWSGHRTVEDAAARARAAFDAGMSTIKFKCNLDDDVVAWAKAIHEACGPTMRIVFDPNERFDELRHAVAIARELEKVGNVAVLEDPLPRWNLEAFAELRTKTTIPIAVHVSLGAPELGQRTSDVLTALRIGAADVFNLSGGIANFMRMSQVADLAGVSYWHGSEVGLGIQEAAHVHTAAAAKRCTLSSDIFGRKIRSHDLLKDPLEFDGEHVKVPTGPGLGVDVDRDALSDHEVGRVTIS